MKTVLRILVVVVLLLPPLCVSARTWYIKADGTGDAPTIQAGIDSATSGDTVLLGPGEYYTYETLELESGVSLVGELGPSSTTITALGELGAPLVTGLDMQPRSALAGVRIWGAILYAAVSAGNGTRIENCVIVGSERSIAVTNKAIEIVSCLLRRFSCYYGTGTVSHNIILETVEFWGALPCIEWNDFVGGIPPYYCGFPETNFSLDPQFCGLEGSGNYFLQEDSPCLPENHPNHVGYGLIGPFSVGCGTVGVESKTWGAIKSVYSDG